MPPASFAGHVLPPREVAAPAAKPVPRPTPAAKPAEKRQTVDSKRTPPRETAPRPLKRTAIDPQDRPTACAWCGQPLARTSPAFVCSWGCLRALAAYGGVAGALACAIDTDHQRRLLDLAAIEAKFGGSVMDSIP